MTASDDRKGFAAIRDEYGPPSVLTVRERTFTAPKPGELLVRVRAATVNRTDCALLTGTPFVMRFFAGLRRPRLSTTGTDFAGEVVAIGDGVTSFAVGDRVFGFDDLGLSSHASYLTATAKTPMARMPSKLSFAEAAASCEGAHYAVAVLDRAKPVEGSRILVHGATGAIGSALVQLLKQHVGAHVTATCPTQHVERVRDELAPDRVIDHLAEDFTTLDERFDFVIDAVGKSTFGACRKLLGPGGVYVSSEPGPRGENLYLPLLTKLGSGPRVVFPFPGDIRASLSLVGGLAEAGMFRPLMDRVVPLTRIREAFEYVASGQKVGNVVVEPED